MKNIPLTRGAFAIVDDEHFKSLSQWKWTFNNGYASRYSKGGAKNRKLIYMHRQILGNASDKSVIDHINQNKLDNRRKNLRAVSRSINYYNSDLSKQSSNTGTSWHKHNKKWQAAITDMGNKIHLGYFDNRNDAVKAYRRKKLKLLSVYAKM